MFKSIKGTLQMKCDQRVIITFLLNERADARDITDRLQAQFGEHAYKVRTIQFWIAEAWLGRQDFHDEIHAGRLPLDDFDVKIMAILDKSPFESARSIAETFHVAHSTVLPHLHDFIDFRSFHLHWVPHLLMHDLREKRKEYAKAMLPFLYATEHDGWHYLMTCDESWFFLNSSPRRIWTLSRDDVITKPRFDIQSKEFMCMIMWNSSGLCIVDRLPNNTKMNSDYFMKSIFIPFEQAIFARRRSSYQK
jgi:hypothetical protein